MKKIIISATVIANTLVLAQKVGVNTQSPTETLDINGTIRIRTLPEGTATDQVLTTDANGVIHKMTSATFPSNTEPWKEVETGNDATSNTQNIFQTGNVGIGAATATAKLDVLTNTTNLARFYYNDGSTNPRFSILGAANKINLATNNSSGGADLVLSTATAPNGLVLKENGNIGVGIATPTEKLHINGIVKAGGQLVTEATKAFAINNGQTSNGYFATIGSQNTSGGLMLGYGVWGKPGALKSFISSNPNQIRRAAIIVGDTNENDGNIQFYTAPIQTTPIDGDIIGMNAKLTILNDGNIGVGKTSPIEKLDIAGYTKSLEGFYSETIVNNTAPAMGGGGAVLPTGQVSVTRIGNKWNSTGASWIRFNKSTMVNNDGSAWIGSVYNNNYGHDLVFASGRSGNIGYGNAAAVNMRMAEDYITFSTTSGSGSNTESVERMKIDHLGKIGIGTSTPTYKLEVANGSVRAESFVANGNIYADYVLENYVDGNSKIDPTYKMLSLSETEKYIKSNKHLPGVTGINDLKIDSNGNKLVDITKLQQQMLEKIEELYLHTIEQNKKIEILNNEIQSLKKNNIKIISNLK